MSSRELNTCHNKNLLHDIIRIYYMYHYRNITCHQRIFYMSSQGSIACHHRNVLHVTTEIYFMSSVSPSPKKGHGKVSRKRAL